LSAGELKATWESFYLNKPQSALRKKEKEKSKKSSHHEPSDMRVALGICFKWNRGLCTKPKGSCKTDKGRELKHICDFTPDPNKPLEVCGKDHIRKDFH